jgi:hypothetical protein
MILHGTCVAIRGRGVLLLGPSGAGKSDLALRLIDRGAALVGDDGIEVERVPAADLAPNTPPPHGREPRSLPTPREETASPPSQEQRNVGDRTGLVARAGPNLHGLLEVRGLGILPFPALAEAPLALAVLLGPAVPRMPDDPPPTRDMLGVALPLVMLDPREPSAAVKVEQALLRYGLVP